MAKDKGYRVVVKIDGGEERGGYSGANNPLTAVIKCLNEIRSDLKDERGRLTIDYFLVSRDEMKSHIASRCPPARSD